MPIKGRHNRAESEAEILASLNIETKAQATRRDLWAARSQAGNWVLAYVSPDRIDPNPNQPRKQIERAALEELKQSIASRGILQPLLGAKSSESRVRLVAGHRRLQAAKELGLARVPVVLVDQLNEEETVIDAVIENIQRRNLEAWEEGVAYAQLADEFGWTHDEIGRKIGKSRPYVSTRIRAAEKLSPAVKEVLATGDWSSLGTNRANLGMSVPASEKNHNVDEVAEPILAASPETTASLNSVEVIRKLTTLSFERQEAIMLQIGQSITNQTKLSGKDIIEIIKGGRVIDIPVIAAPPDAGSGYQLSFVDLGVEELDVFHRWANANKQENHTLSVDEIDRLIELYEKDLSKLRRVRAEKGPND